MKWADRTEVKKGDTGESIVDDWLRNKNIMAYKPFIEGAHPFDRLCASNDKKKIFVLEYKAKAARVYYPDTGFQHKHYKEYTYIKNKYGIDIYICFIDDTMGAVYGNYLKILETPFIVDAIEINEYRSQHKKNKNAIKEKQYPSIENNIIYFPLKKCKILFWLNKESINKLKKFTGNNYE